MHYGRPAGPTPVRALAPVPHPFRLPDRGHTGSVASVRETRQATVEIGQDLSPGTRDTRPMKLRQLPVSRRAARIEGGRDA